MTKIHNFILGTYTFKSVIKIKFSNVGFDVLKSQTNHL